VTDVLLRRSLSAVKGARGLRFASVRRGGDDGARFEFIAFSPFLAATAALCAAFSKARQAVEAFFAAFTAAAPALERLRCNSAALPAASPRLKSASCLRSRYYRGASSHLAYDSRTSELNSDSVSDAALLGGPGKTIAFTQSTSNDGGSVGTPCLCPSKAPIVNASHITKTLSSLEFPNLPYLASSGRFAARDSTSSEGVRFVV
jgi:hypothetical protein